MASTLLQTYNGSLGQSPPVGFRGRTLSQGSKVPCWKFINFWASSGSGKFATVSV